MTTLISWPNFGYRLLAGTVLSLTMLGVQPTLAADYVLRLQLTTDVESWIGDGKPDKTRDVRTLEILITPERRFQGKATWEKEFLVAKGKLLKAKDGIFKIEFDCGHSLTVALPGKRDSDNPLPGIENRQTASTTVTLKPGQTIILGGGMTSATTETPQGRRHETRQTLFRLTLVEDEAGE